MKNFEIAFIENIVMIKINCTFECRFWEVWNTFINNYLIFYITDYEGTTNTRSEDYLQKSL